eukprot:s356_g18.t1
MAMAVAAVLMCLQLDSECVKSHGDAASMVQMLGRREERQGAPFLAPAGEPCDLPFPDGCGPDGCATAVMDGLTVSDLENLGFCVAGLPSPELEHRFAGDPEFREMEDLENKRNKFAIEGEDDTLADLAVQWLNMFNDATKKLIAKRIVKEED